MSTEARCHTDWEMPPELSCFSPSCPSALKTPRNFTQGASVIHTSFSCTCASVPVYDAGDPTLGAQCLLLRGSSSWPPRVLSVSLCSWSPGPGTHGSRPQLSLTAPGEIVRRAKMPQSRTPVTRHCLKWNATQHSFDKVPRRWPSVCVISVQPAGSLS